MIKIKSNKLMKIVPVCLIMMLGFSSQHLFTAQACTYNSAGEDTMYSSAIQDGDKDQVQQQPPVELTEDEKEVDVNAYKVPEFDRSNAAVAKATKLFNESIKAYRAAPAIRDNMQVSVSATKVGEVTTRDAEIPLLISPNASRIVMEDITLTAIDGTIYGEFAPRPTRYYAFDFDGPIKMEMFVNLVGMFAFPQYPMMYSEDPLSRIFMYTPEAQIVGYRLVRDDNNPPREVPEVKIESAVMGAPVTLRFDPDTKLLLMFETWLHDPNLAVDDGSVIKITMDPKILDAEPIEEFIVETDGRREARSMMMITAPPSSMSLIGYEVEDYEAMDLDGNAVKIDPKMGRVTVLLFWNVPIEGLSSVLNMYEDIVRWANAEDLVVDFISVNHGDTLENIISSIDDRKFSFPVYYQTDTLATYNAYRVVPMPTFIIISPNRIVEKVYEEFDPLTPLFEELKKSIRAVLEKDL